MPLTVFSVGAQISIHTLRVEGDIVLFPSLFDFVTISIHTLRVEGDRHKPFCHVLSKNISIHTLRVEGDDFYY